MIEDYEQKLKRKKEAIEIRVRFHDAIEDLFAKYDEIFLIGGDNTGTYCKALTTTS